MATKTFYARGDSSTANNDGLNVENPNQTPTTEITFKFDDDAELTFDPETGEPSTDATVIVDGEEMSFTVEYSGTLADQSKLEDVNGEDLRGEQVVVITLENGQRLFFLPSGPSEETMDEFPNGAIKVDDPKPPVCFVQGTLIATPKGAVAVEDLCAGDEICTEDGGVAVLRWIARREMRPVELLRQSQFRPVCIPAGALGAQGPARDLWLSPQHRVLFRGWQAELLFAAPEVLIPAASFPAFGDRVAKMTGGVVYFHLMFDRHEVILAEGMACESMFPGDGAIASLTPQARSSLAEAFPDYGEDWSGYGPTARPVLSKMEGAVLLANVGLNSAAGADRPSAPVLAIAA